MLPVAKSKQCGQDRNTDTFDGIIKTLLIKKDRMEGKSRGVEIDAL